MSDAQDLSPADRTALAAFVLLCADAWQVRIDALNAALALGSRSARMLHQHHAIELAIARMLDFPARRVSPAEQRIVALAGTLVRLHGALTPAGRDRLNAALQTALSGPACLAPLFHFARTIELQRGRGFTVIAEGLASGAPFDLLLRRDGMEAELACETVSAEDGRDLHRGTWFNLVDGIDSDLQTWLSAHPGRYVLKMTLPRGLKDGAADPGNGLATLAELQRRIRQMLAGQRRADHDEAAVLRLDPLLLAGAQASELGLLDSLRQQFGPEAQLAVTRSSAGMLVMAARAGRENRVGEAVRARMIEAAPARFSRSRPGILAIFLEDTDRIEWRSLRDSLQLEGETRQFLTRPDAAGLVAVTAASRVELLDTGSSDSAKDGEMRFRNQAHPAAKSPALAPAIRSSF